MMMKTEEKNGGKNSGLSVLMMISWLAAAVGCATAIASAIYFPSGLGRFVS